MPVSFSLEDIQLDETLKGFPGHTDPMRISEVGEAKWNVLSEDLPLPLAVLKQSAMDRNSKWMQRFLASSNAVLAPHVRRPCVHSCSIANWPMGRGA